MTLNYPKSDLKNSVDILDNVWRIFLRSIAYSSCLCWLLTFELASTGINRDHQQGSCILAVCQVLRFLCALAIFRFGV